MLLYLCSIMRSPNVSSGSNKTSYVMMIPFWSIAGTSSQETVMDVDDNTSALTLSGGLAGTVVEKDYSIILYPGIHSCNKKWLP